MPMPVRLGVLSMIRAIAGLKGSSFEALFFLGLRLLSGLSKYLVTVFLPTPSRVDILLIE